MELTTFSLLLVTCFGVPAGVSAACSDGEQATWCMTPNVQINGFDWLIRSDTNALYPDCQTECATTMITCKSFSYVRSEKKCSFYTIEGDESTLRENQGSDHYWLLCGEGSCPADTTPPEATTTTTDTTTTTTDTTTTTTTMPTTTTTMPTTTTTADTTTTMPTKTTTADTTTTTAETTSTITTISTTEDISPTPENPTTAPEQNTTTPVQSTSTSENPDSWWKIEPVWAAMIGMTVFAVLLILTIFGLLCLMKSRQHVPKSKEFS